MSGDRHQIFTSAQKFAAQFAGFVQAAAEWENVVNIEQTCEEAQRRIDGLRAQEAELNAHYEQLRREAEADAAKTRGEADAYRARTEAEVEAGAKRTQAAAAEDAKRIIDDATTKAAEAIHEASKKVELLEADHVELDERHTALKVAVAELENEHAKVSAAVEAVKAEHGHAVEEHEQFLAKVGAKRR